MQFSFDIKHVSGVSNGFADMLSHLISDECEELVARFDVDVDPVLNDKIRDAQLYAIKVAKDKSCSAWIHDEVTKMYLNKDALIVVPDSAADVKREIFRATHGTPLVGHVGVKNTVLSIRKAGYHWTAMTADVAHFISECAICQKTRAPADPLVEMKTAFSLEPLRAVAIDAVGPLWKIRMEIAMFKPCVTSLLVR